MRENCDTEKSIHLMFKSDGRLNNIPVKVTLFKIPVKEIVILINNWYNDTSKRNDGLFYWYYYMIGGSGMFNGTHYGEKVTVGYLEEDQSGLLQVADKLVEMGLQYVLLPIIVNMPGSGYPINVIEYQHNGDEKYIIINDAEKLYYATEKLPRDLNIVNLINDVNGQMKYGDTPYDMNSMFEVLISSAEAKANKYVYHDKLSDEDETCLSRYMEIAKKICSEENIEKHPADPDFAEFGDDVFGMDLADEDLKEERVEESAKQLLIYKVMAEILRNKGYDFWNIKEIGDIDHHDTVNQNGGYETTLLMLYNGYNWDQVIRRGECFDKIH